MLISFRSEHLSCVSGVLSGEGAYEALQSSAIPQEIARTSSGKSSWRIIYDTTEKRSLCAKNPDSNRVVEMKSGKKPGFFSGLIYRR